MAGMKGYKMNSMRSMSRHELLDLVWERPISVVAPELGISGPALAKLCERNGIPVPERGYWAKLENGKRVQPKPRLHPPKPGQREQIIIKQRPPKPRLNEEQMPVQLAELLEAERRSVDDIIVPSSPKPHPIVASWTKPQKPSYGIADWSPTAESRRRRIASVLFREIERRGGVVTAQDTTTFYLSLLGQKIEIRLRERLKKVVIPGDKNTKYSWEGGDRTEYHPTSLLQLRIENYLDVPIRREFNETEKQPLETKLRDVIVAWLLAVEAERQRNERFAERERKRQSEQLAALERRERNRKEQEEQQELLAQANAWANALTIRNYVAAVLDKRGDSAAEWARWALEVASRMDPSANDH